MRWLVAVCSVLLTGCLFPTNEIRGRWKVGGTDGCHVGSRISVGVNVGSNEIYGEDYACTNEEFSIGVPAEEQDFVVEIDEITRGYVVVATADVQLARISGDFSIGLVYFVPVQP